VTVAELTEALGRLRDSYEHLRDAPDAPVSSYNSGIALIDAILADEPFLEDLSQLTE
jgi:hypothetical protein